MRHALRFTLMLALALGVSVPGPAMAQIARTPYPAAQRANTSQIVSAGTFVFPSGVAGTKGDVLAQVDEVVERLHRELGTIGLGIGNMVQHTLYLKDGAAQPTAVLGRFHADAQRLAPSLKTQPSVGTIVRLPAFPDPNTLVMVDIVAANPGKGKPDTFARVPFTFGPKEIAESITVNGLLFTAGTEAMNFQNGSYPRTIDEQIEAIVGKMQASLQKSGLTVGNMLSHNLYVTKGTDPKHVIQKFHEALKARAPELAQRPSVGTLAVVDGMAVNGFLLEVDAIVDATRKAGQPDSLKRIPFTPPIDIARSVDAGPLVLLAGFDGVSVPKPSEDPLEQARVVAREIHTTLKASGLSIADVVKCKLYIRKDADANAVQQAFHAEAVKLDSRARTNQFAETVIVVERLDSETAKVEGNAIAARRR